MLKGVKKSQSGCPLMTWWRLQDFRHIRNCNEQFPIWVRLGISKHTSVWMTVYGHWLVFTKSSNCSSLLFLDINSMRKYVVRDSPLMKLLQTSCCTAHNRQIKALCSGSSNYCFIRAQNTPTFGLYVSVSMHLSFIHSRSAWTWFWDQRPVGYRKNYFKLLWQ